MKTLAQQIAELEAEPLSPSELTEQYKADVAEAKAAYQHLPGLNDYTLDILAENFTYTKRMGYDNSPKFKPGVCFSPDMYDNEDGLTSHVQQRTVTSDYKAAHRAWWVTIDGCAIVAIGNIEKDEAGMYYFDSVMRASEYDMTV